MEAKKDDVTRLPVSKRWKQDDYGNVLADCDTYKGAPIISLNPADMDDWQWERSHMAHAVECVNSHSALVAACEKAANMIEHIDEHGHGQGAPRQLSRASLMRVVSELRQALPPAARESLLLACQSLHKEQPNA